MMKGRKRVIILALDFPPEIRGKVNGFSLERDNHFFIGIDRSQSRRSRKRVARHELTHIYRNHHRQLRRPVKILEREADRFHKRARKAPLHTV